MLLWQCAYEHSGWTKLTSRIATTPGRKVKAQTQEEATLMNTLGSGGAITAGEKPWKYHVGGDKQGAEMLALIFSLIPSVPGGLCDSQS